MSSSIERYPLAFRRSQTLLNDCNCSFIPINIRSIIEDYPSASIIIISETEYKQFRAATHQTRPYLKIKDGRTYYNPGMSIYTIVYNDKKPKNRIRFTLAHEFGHIVLQHLSDKRTEIDRGGLPDAVYYAYEGSANTFAGNFLVPPIILYEKLANRVFNTQAIASAFKISEEAVRDYRHDDFLHWQTLKPMLEEVEILARFKKRLYTFFCTTCASIFSIKGAKYCPICGESAVPIRLGDDETMGKIYSGVQLLEDGRVKECLVCKNEEHMEGARYCMVCGKHVINQCSFALTDPDYVDRYADQCQHREPLPGNARYCPYCGSETTFFQSKILPPWGQNDGDEMPF